MRVRSSYCQTPREENPRGIPVAQTHPQQRNFAARRGASPVPRSTAIKPGVRIDKKCRNQKAVTVFQKQRIFRFFCSVAFARVGGFAWLPWGLAPKPPGFFAFLQQRRHGAPGRGAFNALRPGAAVCVTFACSGCFPAVPYPRQCDGCFVAVLFLLRKIEIRIAEQTIHQYH